jgi:Zinc-binding dehydrogenase
MNDSNLNSVDGADELIEYTTQRFDDVARNIDVVLDTIGGETQEPSWQVLKKGGILVSLVRAPSENKAKEHGVRGIRLGARPNGQELAEIAKIIDAGKLTPVIDRVLPPQRSAARARAESIRPYSRKNRSAGQERKRNLRKETVMTSQVIIWALVLVLFGISSRYANTGNQQSTTDTGR